MEKKFMRNKTKKITALVAATTILCSVIAFASGSEMISSFVKPNRNIKNAEIGSVSKETKNISALKSSASAATATQSVQPMLEEGGQATELTISENNQVNEEKSIPNSTNSAPKVPDNLFASKLRLMAKSNDSVVKSRNHTAEDVEAYRLEKLNRLKEKYPAEYELMCQKSELDSFYYVNLLEMIDYWEIADVNAYIDTFIKDGRAGLTQYQTKRRGGNE
jgi:hypothetical protein